MNRRTARTVSLLLVLALNTACSSDDPRPAEDGGANGAGVGGVASGGVASGGVASGGVASGGVASGGTGGQIAAAGAVSAAGTASGGASAGGASAGGSGGGTMLTPEELRSATKRECSKGCTLVHAACPSSNVANCEAGCNSQAESAFASGKCGVELYQAMACINRELTTADVKCPATAGGNAQFNGCDAEQLRFARCN